MKLNLLICIIAISASFADDRHLPGISKRLFSPEAGPSRELEARIQELLTDFEDDNFHIREAAEKALRGLSPDYVIPALEKQKGKLKPEGIRRINKLMKEITPRVSVLQFANFLQKELKECTRQHPAATVAMDMHSKLSPKDKSIIVAHRTLVETSKARKQPLPEAGLLFRVTEEILWRVLPHDRLTQIGNINSDNFFVTMSSKDETGEEGIFHVNVLTGYFSVQTYRNNKDYLECEIKTRNHYSPDTIIDDVRVNEIPILKAKFYTYLVDLTAEPFKPYSFFTTAIGLVGGSKNAAISLAQEALKFPHSVQIHLIEKMKD